MRRLQLKQIQLTRLLQGATYPILAFALVITEVRYASLTPMSALQFGQIAALKVVGKWWVQPRASR